MVLLLLLLLLLLLVLFFSLPAAYCQSTRNVYRVDPQCCALLPCWPLSIHNQAAHLQYTDHLMLHLPTNSHCHIALAGLADQPQVQESVRTAAKFCQCRPLQSLSVQTVTVTVQCRAGVALVRIAAMLLLVVVGIYRIKSGAACTNACIKSATHTALILINVIQGYKFRF
jgi:hypothetical protein